MNKLDDMIDGLVGLGGGMDDYGAADESEQREQLQSVKQQIQALVAEVIGEDEDEETLPFVSNEFVVQRNEMRAEQRERARKLGLL